MRAMIAQDLVRTGDFPKERRIGGYGRLRKIRCAGKGLARACALYEISGLMLAAAGLLAASSLGGCASYHSKPLSAQNGAKTFSERRLASPGLRRYIRSRTGEAPAQWPPKTWTFDQLTLAALYYHPELSLARAQWALARAEAVSAGAYPNPALKLDPFPQYTSNAADGISPWTIGLSVEVPILTAGKRGYRVAQARAKAEAARFDVVQRAWRIRSNLRAALLGLYAARQKIALVNSKAHVAGALAKALQQQFRAGEISAFQLEQAQIQWHQAQLRQANTETAAAEARADAASALGVPESAVAGARFDFADLLRHLPSGKTIPKMRFETWALTQRPDIRAALMQYAASEQALKLAIAGQYPDFQVGPGYQWDQGAHRWSIGFVLSLPIFNQNQGPIAQARASREVAAAKFRTLQAKITHRLDSALAAYRSSRHKLALTEQLLRASRKRLAGARASYEAGETGRVDLLSARLQSESDRLDVLNARVQAAQALGTLEAVLEHPLHRATAAQRAIENVTLPAPASSRAQPERSQT